MKESHNPSKNSFILNARYLLPISTEPIENQAVLTRNGIIAGIGKAEDLIKDNPEAIVKDFENAALLPGFVNVHTHLEIAALRGFLDQFEGDFPSWLLALVNARDEVFDTEDLIFSARMGALEAIENGVTFLADIGRHGIAGFDALVDSGLRGIEYQETEYSPDSRNAEADFATLMAKFELLRDRANSRVFCGISPHSPYSVSPALLRKISEFAQEDNIDLTIHVAESEMEEQLLLKGGGFFGELFKREGVPFLPPVCSSIEYLESIGVLNSKPLLAHCVRVSDSDLEKIKQTGSTIAHCPRSNAKLLHGAAPLADFLAKGVLTGLGSDSVASNNLCDILDEARFASMVSRILEGNAIGSAEFLRMATLGGAEAVGLENEIGSIEVGKYADIIAISLDATSVAPVYNVNDSLLSSARGSDVCFTMVDGEILFERGADDRRALEKKENLQEGLARIARKLRDL